MVETKNNDRKNPQFFRASDGPKCCGSEVCILEICDCFGREKPFSLPKILDQSYKRDLEIEGVRKKKKI